MLFAIVYQRTIWQISYEIVISSTKREVDSCYKSNCMVNGTILEYYELMAGKEAVTCDDAMNPCKIGAKCVVPIGCYQLEEYEKCEIAACTAIEVIHQLGYVVEDRIFPTRKVVKNCDCKRSEDDFLRRGYRRRTRQEECVLEALEPVEPVQILYDRRNPSMIIRD